MAEVLKAVAIHGVVLSLYAAQFLVVWKMTPFLTLALPWQIAYYAAWFVAVPSATWWLRTHTGARKS